MLAKRVVLCLTFSEGVLMRTKRFVPDYRYTQNFSWSQDADDMVLVDITPQPWPAWPNFLMSYTKRGVNIPVMANCRIPDVGYARKLLNSGADALLINYKRREIYEAIAEAFGSQALTAGIDVFETGVRGADSTETLSGISTQAVSRGAGEILLTSMERDGSLAGYDLSALRSVCAGCHVPVVIAGGCGSWRHMKEAFELGASGAATSNIFHLNQTAMRSCKQWLTSNYKGPIRGSAANA